MDVEVWPAFALIKKGHAIHVVVTPTPGGTDASGPHFMVWSNLAGAVLQIQRSQVAVSYVRFALSPVSPFRDACELCAGRAPAN